MGNQHRSDLEGITTLAKNAKLGDGYFWKHTPTSTSKIIYTSIDKDLLKKKMNICPNIFGSGVGIQRKEGTETNFGKSKNTIYRLASLTNDLFSEYHKKTKIEVFQEFNLFDFALWYLDDGCCVNRGEYKNKFYYRHVLCIGETATGCEDLFMKKIADVFSHVPTRNNTMGRITKNNSKATEKNKVWIIPNPIAMIITNIASKFHFIGKKFPYIERSEIIPNGSRGIGQNSVPKRQLQLT